MSEHHTCARIIKAVAEILKKAQGITDAETSRDIDIGGECMDIRHAVDALMRENAELRAREEPVAVEFAIFLDGCGRTRAALRRQFAAFKQSDAYPKPIADATLAALEKGDGR